MKNSGLVPVSHYGDGRCKNAVIQGDSRTVCELLKQALQDRVKCIYIDPPYNNGEEYNHYSDSRARKEWLADMGAVLGKLFPLLSPDGSIWISIDDTELHYLKVLCDEAFGEKSFVSTIVWQHRTTRENRRAFSNNHEYILLYAKNFARFKASRNPLPLSPEILRRYRNPDNDPRGAWQSVSLNVQDGHAVASQFYDIVSPGGVSHSPPNGRCWIYNRDRMCAEIAQGNVWFGADGKGVPRKKKFLRDSKDGLTPETLWTAAQVGTTNQAKKHLLALFPGVPVFDTPKPETLVKRIIEIATSPGDLVLDAFLGSGTTAAVAHKLGREYIGIDRSGESIEYAVERLKRVVDGEPGGVSEDAAWAGGGGFSLFSAAP